MNLLKGDSHLFWMDQSNGMKDHLELIRTTDQLDDQRRQFSFLSDLLIRSIRTLGIEGNTYYIQHCSMAFNNEGADWLSLEETIQNPYFGEKMPSCGEIKGMIQPAMKMPISNNQDNQNRFHNH